MEYDYTLGMFVEKNFCTLGKSGAGHVAEVRMRQPRGNCGSQGTGELGAADCSSPLS